MPSYLKVGTEPLLLRITSEPYVIYTSRGYAPVVDVADCKTSEVFTMFISAASIARKLESLRRANDNSFTGLEFWIRKESNDRMAPYVLEQP